MTSIKDQLLKAIRYAARHNPDEGRIGGIVDYVELFGRVRIFVSNT